MTELDATRGAAYGKATASTRSARSSWSWGRRLYAHITRRRARSAIVLSAFSLLIYALAPTVGLNSDVVDPVQQFALILTGVAASAIFLPELSSDLWTISRRQVRQLIPDQRRQELARELIGAESDDNEWSDVVYEQALAPLLDASRRPWLVVKNMTYSIQIHLNSEKTVAGRRVKFHSVETAANSLRILPPISGDGYYWITVARTEQALLAEFAESGCLLRELVPLTDADGAELIGDAWQHAAAQLCHAGITINGQVQSTECDVPGPNPDVLRWRFRPEYPEVGQRVPLQMSLDYPMSVREDRFPVYFASYYCAGATVLTMRLYGLSPEASLTCESFFARGLIASAGPGHVASTAGTLAHQIAFSTGRDSILWPGSGVVFNWHRCVAGAPVA